MSDAGATTARRCEASCMARGGLNCEGDAGRQGLHRGGSDSPDGTVYWEDGSNETLDRAGLLLELQVLADLLGPDRRLPRPVRRAERELEARGRRIAATLYPDAFGREAVDPRVGRPRTAAGRFRTGPNPPDAADAPAAATRRPRRPAAAPREADGRYRAPKPDENRYRARGPFDRRGRR